MHLALLSALVVLEGCAVLFVALHNWVPLGALNNRRGVRIVFPTGTLLRTTLLNLTPTAFGFVASIVSFGRFPEWLVWYLWIFYGFALYGSLRAWWLPYLVRPDEALAARYRTMYAGTHAFLPERNGITPNTLHIIFDVLVIGTLIVLALLSFGA
jgi:hypothetical protein